MLYVLALVAIVVGVNVMFFRNRFWERLIVNVGIVLVRRALPKSMSNASVLTSWSGLGIPPHTGLDGRRHPAAV